MATPVEVTVQPQSEEFRFFDTFYADVPYI